ncbi:DUF805 domain-containing protein [Arthrobacter sedimenti]|uniref:DUF805 domain-containing protein n=1 Tax=Arthrobacter sedimenti TaxID=2694931 RepID=UPI001CDC9E42|nr:DUF805 domain-containing protein [Arthrobacter sedimenti]
MGRFVGRAFQLRGRASRSESWWWMLVNVILLATTQLLVPAIVSGRTPQSTLSFDPFGSALFANIELSTVHPTDAPSSPLAAFSLFIAGLWLIVTIVPGFTIAIRRLHDSNLSGWWVLLALVPPGAFILLLLAIRRPRPDGARFDR